MPKPRFRIKDDEVKRFFSQSIGAAQTKLRAATLAAAEPLRTEAARKAPGPHIDVKMKFVGNRRAQILIGPDKKHWYYRFFETGTQPHEVSARRRQALKFDAASGVVFSDDASVSGIPARPFLRPAADSKLDEAGRAFDKVMRG